jgi:hypothetical protein
MQKASVLPGLFCCAPQKTDDPPGVLPGGSWTAFIHEARRAFHAQRIRRDPAEAHPA